MDRKRSGWPSGAEDQQRGGKSSGLIQVNHGNSGDVKKKSRSEETAESHSKLGHEPEAMHHPFQFFLRQITDSGWPLIVRRQSS